MLNLDSSKLTDDEIEEYIGQLVELQSFRRNKHINNVENFNKWLSTSQAVKQLKQLIPLVIKIPLDVRVSFVARNARELMITCELVNEDVSNTVNELAIDIIEVAKKNALIAYKKLIHSAMKDNSQYADIDWIITNIQSAVDDLGEDVTL